MEEYITSIEGVRLLMDIIFKQIIDDYIDQVTILCTNLLDTLKLQDKTQLIEYLYMGKHRVWELNVNDVNYKFHGAGCDAYYEGKFIQWDFGRRSHWCGIDPWFISTTLKANCCKFSQFYDGNFVKCKCEEAVKNGEMYLWNGKYYYTIPLNETFKPHFPKEFDSVVIEYFDKRWQLKKNKEIERFIRKSTYVYQNIEKNPYKYVLKFMQGDDIIYTIPYDDVSYPENAVIIMSDNIIRNLEKIRASSVSAK